MKENCKECRYNGKAVIQDTRQKREIDNWCRMKRRETPNNPCRWWRPKEAKGACK
jgi:hypothetical protein